jgi:BirA family biotin operon repressor/biotin-[acetyl-CoA-carboxylase] ligase
MPLPDEFAEPLARAGARLGRFASRISYIPEATSTSDIAADLASRGAPEGTTILADAQSAGRGRRGRSWFSPPGAGLYTSVILRPQRAQGERLPIAAVTAAMTLAAGVAVAEAIRHTTGLPVTLKWPNDVVVEDPPPAATRRRKLAGILTEGSAAGSELQYAILGFGINVRPMTLPADLRATVTSIESELGRAIDRGTLFAESLAALEARYSDLLDGRIDAILTRWRELSPQAAARTCAGVPQAARSKA